MTVVWWTPLGTVIEYVEWWGVPDKYAAPQCFGDREQAERYASEHYGIVEAEPHLRAPDGTTWSRRGSFIVEGDPGFELAGAVAVGHRFRLDHHRSGQTCQTAVEAEAEAERRDAWCVLEHVRFRDTAGRRAWVAVHQLRRRDP
ncbi:hypothetical protein [Thermomonospora amylolytica]|uniref:hypothetical protein n=1 Tax=Thermomonospora amylolytica TaxID=1411117 RepID=UPI000E6C5579|nr:hypothetical protein [Thermomonospora amylolytica]